MLPSWEIDKQQSAKRVISTTESLEVMTSAGFFGRLGSTACCFLFWKHIENLKDE
uniref:Uncharacterized protein n=1 Tax=Physcomitrium patens TaxID=3218 RepID=A0A2K1KX64_PHYPA|nr:hypothetical protein PHYPA_005335 [Physcomitrium patens]